jgi:hypothetical protein
MARRVYKTVYPKVHKVTAFRGFVLAKMLAG